MSCMFVSSLVLLQALLLLFLGFSTSVVAFESTEGNLNIERLSMLIHGEGAANVSKQLNKANDGRMELNSAL